MPTHFRVTAHGLGNAALNRHHGNHYKPPLVFNIGQLKEEQIKKASMNRKIA